MKVLIWFGCLFISSAIPVALRSKGILLGAIPTALLFAGTIWLAKTLSGVWDTHKASKAQAASVDAPKPVVQIGSNFSGWQCSCGRIHSQFETSCLCGKNKRDSMASKPHFCRKCGKSLLDGSQFCRNCGAGIVTGGHQQVCRQCAKVLPDDSAFCQYCGTQTNGSNPEA